jgi:hypothetical protein
MVVIMVGWLVAEVVRVHWSERRVLVGRIVAVGFVGSTLVLVGIVVLDFWEVVTGSLSIASPSLLVSCVAWCGVSLLAVAVAVLCVWVGSRMMSWRFGVVVVRLGVGMMAVVVGGP